MNEKIQKLKGANMDIDLASPQESITWPQDACPWNAAEKTDIHKCAVKNVSICPYFCGVEYTLPGHKLRFRQSRKAQFVTGGIIYRYDVMLLSEQESIFRE